MTRKAPEAPNCVPSKRRWGRGCIRVPGSHTLIGTLGMVEGEARVAGRASWWLAVAAYCSLSFPAVALGTPVRRRHPIRKTALGAGEPGVLPMGVLMRVTGWVYAFNGGGSPGGALRRVARLRQSPPE